MRAGFLVLCACLTACDADEDVEVEAPTEHDEPPPVERSPAQQLAHRVVQASGDFSAVSSLEFRFVVDRDGERVFEAHHRWDRVENRDRVTWTEGEGHRFDAVVDTTTRRACGTVDGVPDTGDELSEKAYGRFINDAYWLLMPLKLLDDGVHLELEAPRERDGTHYEILRMSFDGVGLTPGDVYWLYVDPNSDRVVRWEMLLEGGDPNAVRRATAWSDYREVGPLVLAHDHLNDEGTRRVHFEDVRELPIVDGEAFRIEGCPEPEFRQRVLPGG